MASFASFRYLLAFLLLNLYLKCLAANQNFAFSYDNFGKDSNFESKLSLYGDAKVVSNGITIEIAGSRAFSSGRVICKKPFNLVERNSRKMVSFSSYFVFSMSKENGDGLAFVMLPVGFPLNVFDGGSMGMLGDRKVKYLAIEFDTFKDDKYGDMNGNHVGVNVESLVSLKARNVSIINLVLNSGEKLQTWIDYEASSKRFEVRLSRFGDERPVDPLLTFFIDLSIMWKWENVTVGLSSSSGNSSQKSILYSWSFRTRTVPHSMHSEPVDPENVTVKGKEMRVSKRSGCALKIVTTLLLGIGCGALGAVLVLFVWTTFGSRRPVVPEEFTVPSKKFGYEKFTIVAEKAIEDGKK